MELPRMEFQPLVGDETFYSDRFGRDLPRIGDVRHLLVADQYDPGPTVDLDKTTTKELVKQIQLMMRGGLSLLAAAANTIDKPFAATRGLLAGDWKQVLFLLPFSESYLRDFYTKKLGLPIPERHITGREVLEKWGLPSNKPGFHPIRDPLDALLDVAGFALELAVAPPYLPRLGAITSHGERLFRLSSTAARETHALDEALRVGGKLLARGELKIPALPLDDQYAAASQLAKSIGKSDDLVEHVHTLIGAMPDPQRQRWLTEFNTYIQTGNRAAAGRMLEQLPQFGRFAGAVQSGVPIVPSTTITGRALEMRTGERGIILQPMYSFLPRIEITGTASRVVGQAMERVAELPGIRHLRAMFDWTVKDAVSVHGQRGAQAYIDSLRNLTAGARDLFQLHQQYIGTLADEFARYHQLARLGNNAVGIHTFDQLLDYIGQFGARYRLPPNQRALEIAKKIANGEQVPDSFIQYIQEVDQFVNGSLGNVIKTINEQLSRMGVDMPEIAPLFADYIPAYKRTTPFGTTAAHQAGESLVTAESLRRRMRKSNPYRYTPHVTINLASQDPLLFTKGPKQSIKLEGITLVDRPVLKANDGVVFTYGDYLADKQTGNIIGRIVGFTEDGKIVARTRGLDQAVTFNPGDVLRSAPPSNPADAIPIAPYQDQKQAMLQWLTENGITIDPEIAKNNKYFVHQAYVYHRYFKPYIEGIPDSERFANLFFNERFELKRKELESLLEGYDIPKSEIKRIYNLAKKKNGLSWEFVRHISKRSGTPVYSEDILADHFRYVVNRLDALAAVNAVHEIIRRAAFDPERFGRIGIPLEQAYRSIQFPIVKSGRLVRYAEMNNSGLEFLTRMLFNTRDDLSHLMSLDAPERAIHVPAEAVEQANRMLKTLVPGTPERLALENAIRKYLGTVSAWLTSPRVAFHVRNHISNLILAATADAPYSVTDLLKTHVNDILPNWTPDKIKNVPYLDEMLRQGVLSARDKISDVTLEGLGKLTTPAAYGLRVSLEKPVTLHDAVAALRAPISSYTSLAATGERTNPLIKAGYNLFSAVEGLGRATVYVAARKAGMTPSQASELVNKILYDYSRLSGFERRFLQPAIMFYSWLRQNSGYMVPRILFDWSSGPAQMARLVGRIQSQFTETEMPEWLQDSLGIPIYRTKDGRTVVLKSLGLPIQDLAMFSPQLSKFMANVVSRTNPILRAIYMVAAEEEPFTGMPLNQYRSQLEKITGITIRPPDAAKLFRAFEAGIPGVSYLAYLGRAAAGDSPLWARVIDAISGINVGTYDLDRMAVSDAMDRLKEALVQQQGVRSLEIPYIPKDEKVPEHVKALQQVYSALQRQLRKEKREQESPARVSPMFPTR